METVPAEIDEHGNVKLLARPSSSSKRRTFVTILDDEDSLSETALLSGAALAEDWNRLEEEDAWSHLRQDR